MRNRRLHPHEWQGFFDHLSREYQRSDALRYAMLRVSSSELQGSWNVVPWLEFEGISYDPTTVTLDVKVGGFEHQIENPVMIWAGTQPDGTVDRVLVLRRDGSKDDVTFSKYRFPFSGVVYDARPPSGDGIRFPDRAKKGAMKRLWGRLVRRAD